MLPRWLMLLCVYLGIWIPFNFAALAERSLPSLDSRGLAASLELGINALATMLAATAAFMLWVRNPAGAMFGRVALVLGAAVTVQGLYASALPRDLAPGLALPIAALTVAHAAAWIVYINRSRRLREWLGDGDTVPIRPRRAW